MPELKACLRKAASRSWRRRMLWPSPSLYSWRAECRPCGATIRTKGPGPFPQKGSKAAKTPPVVGGNANPALGRDTVIPKQEAPPDQASRAPNGGQPSKMGPEANKRQILQSLLDGSGDVRGHSFALTNGSKGNNMQIKCEECGLWIQQTDTKPVFHRKVSNFCKKKQGEA